MEKYKDTYIKTVRVIESCKTEKQIKYAAEYLKLAIKEQSPIHRDILFTQWIAKQKQLESIAGLAGSQS